MKICKDGRIYGQNNKEAGSHLGVLTGPKLYVKRGHNKNSVGRPFKMGQSPWHKGTKGLRKAWNKGTGTPNVYSEQFLLGYRKLIRERDGYICQLCGCPELECDENLSVHHIDYDKHNDAPENLISLCRRCHVKTNTNRRYWKEYSWR